MSVHRPVIVLLSGGLDSATCLAIARVAGYSPLHTLAFDYGQRHRGELDAARAISAAAGARHRPVTIDLRQFGGSALTDDMAVPKDRSDEEIGHGVPVTYVPARNTIFLSYALAWAEVINCQDVFIGVNALDCSGYPDCRPDYIAAFQQMARLGTRLDAFTVHAPLATMTKAQIIQRGLELGVDYSQTHSCYDPASDGRACGHCDACLLRKRGFAQARVPDPTRYA
jgi:7-cyano-7-deazaguanine synthase